MTRVSNLELKSTSFPEMLIALSNFAVALLITSSHLFTPSGETSPLLVSEERVPALSSASTSLRSSTANSNKATPPTQVLDLTRGWFFTTSSRNARDAPKSLRARWTIPRTSDRMHSSSVVSRSTRVAVFCGDGSEEVGTYWLEIETGGVNLLRSSTCARATSSEILACVFQTEGKFSSLHALHTVGRAVTYKSPFLWGSLRQSGWGRKGIPSSPSAVLILMLSA